jgi:deoxycytidine triphosphate deaminase
MIVHGDILAREIPHYDIVDPFDPEFISTDCVVLHLGQAALKYEGEIDLMEKPGQEVQYETFNLPCAGYALRQGHFILAHTHESIKLPPHYEGYIESTDQVARAALFVRDINGQHIAPDSSGPVVLGISNVGEQTVRIYPGIPFVRLFLSDVGYSRQRAGARQTLYGAPKPCWPLPQEAVLEAFRQTIQLAS